MSSASAASTASPATRTAHPALLVFDPDGDLQFEVGDETRKVSCDVDSKTVARASPVFERMLFGGFAESKPSTGDAWVVRLPEDDINAMAILFDIIHGRAHKVPKLLPKSLAELAGPSAHCDFDDAVETDVLYLVVVAADKYDIIHLLRPWAKYWLERIKGKKRWDRKRWENSWCAELLWAAWMLGDRGLLFSQLNKVVLSAKVTDVRTSVPQASSHSSEVCVVDSFGREIKLSQIGFGPDHILEILHVQDEIYRKRLDALGAVHASIQSFIRSSPNLTEQEKMLKSYPFNLHVDFGEFLMNAETEAYEEVKDALIECLGSVGISRRDLELKRYTGSVTELRQNLREVTGYMRRVLGPTVTQPGHPIYKSFQQFLNDDVMKAKPPKEHLVELDEAHEREFWRKRKTAGIW